MGIRLSGYRQNGYWSKLALDQMGTRPNGNKPPGTHPHTRHSHKKLYTDSRGKRILFVLKDPILLYRFNNVHWGSGLGYVYILIKIVEA